ncbi:DNA polymerase IV [Dermacoccaceae bacterium W4C1]
MRSEASILHLDLDAFFAAVEQRDKPSLRGRPVVVGGTGLRGVVSTASYEARAYGARSAMPTAEARRRCPPGTAFLSGRFAAYRASSAVVMELLREVSPLVEQVSVDEAYVDLSAAATMDCSDPDQVRTEVQALLARITTETGGLTASAGVASSKMLAKIASDLDKPNGLVVVEAGREQQILDPLAVRKIGGVGPATAERLKRFGAETVEQLRRLTLPDLISIFGEAHGNGLYRAARGQDDREVVVERETKSISAEETFAQDITDRAVLGAEVRRLVEGVSARLRSAELFARTVTLKVRHPDFSLQTRSATVGQATDRPDQVVAVALRLLEGVDVSGGLRLIGVGVSGFSPHAQDELELGLAARLPASTRPEIDYEAGSARPALELEGAGGEEGQPAAGQQGSPGPGELTAGATAAPSLRGHGGRFPTGADVSHREHGAGWVWGSGLGRVTVRFEGPLTGPGPVHTFAVDDPDLHPAQPPAWKA